MWPNLEAIFGVCLILLGAVNGSIMDRWGFPRSLLCPELVHEFVGQEIGSDFD